MNFVQFNFVCRYIGTLDMKNVFLISTTSGLYRSFGHSSLRRPSLRPKCRKKSNSNFSALELDRDLGFSRGHQGHQGHQPHDDDDDGEEDDKVEDNNKDDNNDKGISALGLDRDLKFSRGHQGCQ